MRVTLQNERSGEIKAVKVGWSWTLFFFSTLWGVPLFFRRVYGWAGVAVALNVASFYLMSEAEDGTGNPTDLLMMFAVFVGFTVFMAIKGNEITAKSMLENGWQFVDHDYEVTEHAKQRWSLA